MLKRYRLLGLCYCTVKSSCESSLSSTWCMGAKEWSGARAGPCLPARLDLDPCWEGATC